MANPQLPKNDNLVSFNLSKEDLQEIDQAIQLIRNKLSTLISLSPHEIKAVFKTREGFLPFVKAALHYAESNPAFVPPYVDIPELKKDVEAIAALENIYRPLSRLCDSLEDTAMVAGSEAYVASMAFYNAVKAASEANVEGTTEIYCILKYMLFSHGGKEIVIPPAQGESSDEAR